MDEVKVSKASFIQWFAPLINALRELGGSATPEKARDQIARDLNLGSDVIAETRGKTGGKKFANEVAWARNYLAYEELIDKSVRGVWTLTPKGMEMELTDEMASEIFFKWVNILKERREGNPDPTTVQNQSDKRLYWMYAPGEGSNMWNEFYDNGIMGIGWDELGDFKQYPTKESMKEKMKVIYGQEYSYKNAGHATWQFANEIKKGDIIFVKKGIKKIIGRGVVTSDYIFDQSREEYRHIRTVNWTHKGEWDHEGQIVMKTLTNITPYTDYYKRLENMFAVSSDDLLIPDVVAVSKFDEYTADDFLSEVFMPEERYNTLKNLLLKKKNIILQGAPGVGKTYAAERLAYSIMGEKDTSRVMVIQFHQSYSYEDFIMGYRPTESGFSLTKGPFYDFCKEAEPDDREYFFIIDEINRGNLSRIFGELLMLIENDKRGKELRLLYSDEQFSVPENVYIIGMMNTADRSLAMIDYALRRRFAFFEFEPAFASAGFKRYQATAANKNLDSLIGIVEAMNRVIASDASLGSGFCVGHSYFCTGDVINDGWLSDLVEYELIPLIKEYWFDEPSKVEHWSQKLRGAIT
ncbi:AAA family ATPase [Desulfosporosinus hippei]|uniref:5-methylcytosine-specific restriction enzyme B n=1 Tax=Desulfosporosinus hippei DSM 8344 TaxID=1121419 RepID=A0A1G8L707_9FIRM|nr:5-methylcytosine-specific restriction enzyme B [Desulfosporosinus hippei DSM 8344]